MPRPLLLVAAIALVGLGFVAGRLTAPDAESAVAPASAEVAPLTKPSPSASSRRAARVEPVPTDDLATAKAEAATWKALYDGLALEVYGEPIPFPADTPEPYTEAGVKAAVDEILRECDVPGELVGVDCAEYPCMIRFRSTDLDVDTFQRVTSCPAWSERYGNGASMAQGAADCGDGRKEPVLQLAPSWAEAWKQLNADGNLAKRNEARWEESLAQWSCAPPPSR